MDIFYSRLAFYDAADPTVRLTFDSDILFRDYELDLKNGIYGERVLQKGLYLMELKTAGAMPIWTAEMLSSLKIYPSSKSFAVTIALLPVIVQVIIMLVNGNLGTGIAVAGAFSLVRFRSAPVRKLRKAAAIP